MAEVTALLFLCMGILAFTRKLKPFKVLSSIVLYFSFIAVKENVPLQFFYVVIILIALIPLIYIKTSREKKDVFFFSIPCWLYIVSVLVSVNVETRSKPKSIRREHHVMAVLTLTASTIVRGMGPV